MTKYHVVQISDRDVAGWIVAGASYDGKMPAGLYLTTLVAMGVEAGRKLGAQARLEPLDDGLHDVARSAARELMGTGLVGITDNLFRLQSFLDRYPARGIAEQHNPAALPDDVRALVIAAREVTDAGTDDPESRALLEAVEAFSSRVPYENEPGAVVEMQEGAAAAASPVAKPGEVVLWLHAPTLGVIAANGRTDQEYYIPAQKVEDKAGGYSRPVTLTIPPSGEDA